MGCGGQGEMVLTSLGQQGDGVGEAGVERLFRCQDWAKWQWRSRPSHQQKTTERESEQASKQS